MVEYKRIRDDLSDFWPVEAYRIVDEGGKLLIDLTDGYRKRLRVAIGEHRTYRRIEEGYALVMLSDLPNTSDRRHWLYSVDHSDFLSWFHGQSYDVHIDTGLVHYSVLTSVDIIDVISYGEPIVTDIPVE